MASGENPLLRHEEERERQGKRERERERVREGPKDVCVLAGECVKRNGAQTPLFSRNHSPSVGETTRPHQRVPPLEVSSLGGTRGIRTDTPSQCSPAFHSNPPAGTCSRDKMPRIKDFVAFSCKAAGTQSSGSPLRLYQERPAASER